MCTWNPASTTSTDERYNAVDDFSSCAPSLSPFRVSISCLGRPVGSRTDDCGSYITGDTSHYLPREHTRTHAYAEQFAFDPRRKGCARLSEAALGFFARPGRPTSRFSFRIFRVGRIRVGRYTPHKRRWKTGLEPLGCRVPFFALFWPRVFTLRVFFLLPLC